MGAIPPIRDGVIAHPSHSLRLAARMTVPGSVPHASRERSGGRSVGAGSRSRPGCRGAARRRGGCRRRRVEHQGVPRGQGAVAADDGAGPVAQDRRNRADGRDVRHDRTAPDLRLEAGEARRVPRRDVGIDGADGMRGGHAPGHRAADRVRGAEPRDRPDHVEGGGRAGVAVERRLHGGVQARGRWQGETDEGGRHGRDQGPRARHGRGHRSGRRGRSRPRPTQPSPAVIFAIGVSRCARVRPASGIRRP